MGRRRKTQVRARKDKTVGGSGSVSQVKAKILVQGVGWGVPSLRDLYAELYTIDLEKNQVLRCPHILFEVTGISTVVALGSVIYHIGGAMHPESPPSPVPADDDRRVHNGLSYLDLNQNQGWNSAPSPEYYQYFVCPNSVAFCGKIYVFGYEEKIEVFDPRFNTWNVLLPPPGLEGLTVTKPVLLDPPNDCILIHIRETNDIYAYYPARNRWELVTQDFRFWSNRIAFEDGVLCVYHPFWEKVIDAYDIKTKELLNVDLSSTFDPSVTDSEFEALLHMGNGMLCLLTYAPVYGTEPKTLIYTVVFRVQRRTGSPRDVLVTPVSVKSYTIEDMIRYPNFVALS